MDSPGYSAQYCSYTMMDNTSKKIVSLETMDKRHVERKSSNMEKACFIKTVQALTEKEISISEIVTDSHMQISALMSECIIVICWFLNKMN